jgi:small redox-active disulfide protein 2
MIIEVCGPGCPRCQATEKNVLQALKELGMKLGEDAMVTEIKDVKQISARGVIITPAVVIDGVKVCEGRIPSADEVKKWIEERR